MDDYQADIHFGTWLKKQRERSGLSLEEAAMATGIEVARLKSLEVGYAERGITRLESVRLAEKYKLPLEEFLSHAQAS